MCLLYSIKPNTDRENLEYETAVWSTKSIPGLTAAPPPSTSHRPYPLTVHEADPQRKHRPPSCGCVGCDFGSSLRRGHRFFFSVFFCFNYQAIVNFKSRALGGLGKPRSRTKLRMAGYRFRRSVSAAKGAVLFPVRALKARFAALGGDDTAVVAAKEA